MMSIMPCSSQIFRSAGRKLGGGVRKPPSPWMGSIRIAAVSDGALCCFRIHLRDSMGALQHERALYASYGLVLGGSCGEGMVTAVMPQRWMRTQFLVAAQSQEHMPPPHCPLQSVQFLASHFLTAAT